MFSAGWTIDVQVRHAPYRALPVIATAMLDGVSGSACGSQENVALKASAELIERMHFVRECEPEPMQGDVSSTNLQNLDSILDAVAQASDAATARAIVESRLLLTVRHGLTDFATVIPHAMVTLRGASPSFSGQSGPERPDFLLDSSGCAAHTNADAAVRNAAMEFLERQYFMACWRANHAEYSLHWEIARSLAGECWRGAIDWLHATGDLRIVCLVARSDIFVVFASHASCPRKIGQAGFACGSSASTTLNDAVAKAIAEVWFGRVFDLSIGVLAAAEASHSAARIKQYRWDTFEHLLPPAWCAAPPAPVNVGQSSADPSASTGPLQHLAALRLPYYVYQRHSSLFPGWHVARIVSPRYFVRFSTDGANNFDNSFFDRFVCDRKIANLEPWSIAHPVP
jgi:hypothetical protein